MRQLSRKVTAAGFIGLALTLALAGLAWACTAQAQLQIIPAAHGPAGSQVSVTGNSGTFRPHPVEIRWNSAGGPVLATSETSAGPQAGRTFSTQVTIPDASPGVYYLLATIQGQGVARAAFEVSSAGAATTGPSAGARQTRRVEADLWSGLGASTVTDAPAASALPERGAGSSMLAGTAFLALGAAALSAVAVVGVGRRRSQRAIG